MDEFKEIQTLPEWESPRYVDGKAEPATPGKFRWSNPQPPPSIGAKIHIRMNGIGPAIVTGYFTQHGWLGVKCRLLDAPEWHRRQNKGNPTGHVFGAEFKLLEEEG